MKYDDHPIQMDAYCRAYNKNYEGINSLHDAKELHQYQVLNLIKHWSCHEFVHIKYSVSHNCPTMDYVHNKFKII